MLRDLRAASTIRPSPLPLSLSPFSYFSFFIIFIEVSPFEQPPQNMFELVPLK